MKHELLPNKRSWVTFVASKLLGNSCEQEGEVFQAKVLNHCM